MPINPYAGLIALYFPPEEQVRANCIMTHECSPAVVSYPATCTAPVGSVDCGNGLTDGQARGIWKLLDVCFDPGMNSMSPFTVEQWVRVEDPNVCTWMASVIWSRYGWRAWSSCDDCQDCDISGGPIPYPRGPVSPPMGDGASLLQVLGVAVVVVGALVWAARSTGGYR